MTYESEGLLIIAIYIWLPPVSYVVFLTTLVVTYMYVVHALKNCIRTHCVLKPINQGISYTGSVRMVGWLM